MSKAINWRLLRDQLSEIKEYKSSVWGLVDSPEFNSEKKWLVPPTTPTTVSPLPLLINNKNTPDTETINFMRGLMDECTHLGNYSLPVNTDMIELVVAEHDAYQPRQGVVPLDQLWQGCGTRIINEGHIRSYLLHQNIFRSAIYHVFDKMGEKTEGS